ncbi:hypothetical protein CORC01_12323 [Colletotrichum orchidophilum]|uniref:Uncharacterized protein n=1 Tax=Colletotrichum orchidophilum TaxID=1209926 RepID=A0A1G4ATG9_9PEZI|nr:uncharacterized protein CORC01_12323 [Colletotrichum orchidophilum]OHE92396.1 hypothetical protein CORC01_12323 [Colletotrichum orchidophilum]
MPMSQQASAVMSICAMLKASSNLTIAFNEIPRHQIEVKPEEGDFTLPDVRRILAFLWSASPHLTEPNAPYGGPGSATASGLDFARIFSPDSHAFLSDAKCRGEPTEAVFTHGPPVADKIDMLQPSSIHGIDIEKETFLSIETAGNVNSLMAGTEIYVKDWEGKLRILSGGYNFSRLLNKDPTKRAIGFSQHASTLDSDAIGSWVKVCHGIVDFCLNEIKDRVDHAVEQQKLPNSDLGFSGSYTASHLLEDLNLYLQAAYYEALGPNPFVPELATHGRRKPAINLDDDENLSPYTFGIELEFLVPYTRSNDNHTDETDQRWVYHNDTPTIFAAEPTPEDEPDELAAAIDQRNKAYNASANRVEGLLCDAGHFSATFATLWGLRNNEYPAKVSLPGLQPVADAAGFQLYFVNGVDAEFQCWYVKKDLSLSSWAFGEKGYAGHVGMEVASPILRDSPEDFGKVSDVLRILRSGLRPMLDIGCDLHVHVGNVRKFSLLGMKRIVTLLLLVDPILYTIVHPSRKYNALTLPFHQDARVMNDGQDLPDYTAASGFNDEEKEAEGKPSQAVEARVLLDLEAHVPISQLPRKVRNELAQLWSMDNLDDFTSELRPFRGCRGGTAFVTCRLIENHSVPSTGRCIEGTIEFRMLEGTLDPELITRWTKLLLRVVERAEATTTSEYFEMLAALAEERESDDENLAALLGALGLEKHLPFWRKALQKNQALDIKLVETDQFGLKILPEKWELPQFREYKGEYKDKQARKRDWYEQHVFRLPELDDDTLDRVRDIL